ncbi:MAG: hypothetical protein NTX25_13400 [Proteobacteria bacterium]|nr:hypothetical protein [Pseudomonadota bacterium]
MVSISKNSWISGWHSHPETSDSRISLYARNRATRLLISEEDDSEELTLPVQGKKSALKRTHFVFLGENLKIPAVTIERTLEFFIESEQLLRGAIAHRFLPDSLKIQYETLMTSRISRLE